jgi:hypothetical protein
MSPSTGRLGTIQGIAVFLRADYKKLTFTWKSFSTLGTLRLFTTKTIT